MDPLSIIVLGIFAVAVVGLPLAAFLQRRKAPPKPDAPQAAPEEEGPRCPCGARATRPLPRARVVELPLVGRIIRRDRDPFAALVVCPAHADVADTVIDERIAEAKLADARAQRDKITAIANGPDVLGAVASTLPEEKQRAWKRSLNPPPAVRVLRAANDDASGDGG